MIILLNGSINAGKTTVSKQLVRLVPQTAHIEVDNLRECIRFMPLDKAIPLSLQNAVAVTRNFAAFGLNVIISWPLSQDSYDYLMCELRPLGVPIFAVTLSPALSVALTNRGTRELTVWELQRIPYHYETGIASPEFGIVIDNTHQTPEETAQEILEAIQEPKNAAK